MSEIVFSYFSLDEFRSYEYLSVLCIWHSSNKMIFFGPGWSGLILKKKKKKKVVSQIINMPVNKTKISTM